MTNQAIIISLPNAINENFLIPSPLQEVNGKAFLHYQLQYLSDNLFEKIVLLYNGENEKYVETFGDIYLGMEIIHLSYELEKKQSGNIIAAMQHISDPYVFIFNANNYFRLNLAKADNYRRMRDSKLLLIGKKAENHTYISEKLFLNEKGKIIKIINAEDTRDIDTYNTDTWLINLKKFNELFKEKSQSIFKDYLQSEYRLNQMYCLACKQYYISITSNDDIKKAENDFEENYYE